MSLRWLNALLGAWLVVTGILAGPGSPEFGDHLFLGLAVFLVSFLAMAVPWLRALNVLLGAWTVLSPFVFGYERAQLALNDIVVGILVVWVASTSPRQHRHEDRGHLPVAR